MWQIGIVLMPIGSGSQFPFWCRSRFGFGAYPKFYTCWKIRIFFIPAMQCSVFLVRVIAVIIYCIIYFWQYTEIFRKKGSVCLDIWLKWIPRYRPTKWCRSYRIRIHTLKAILLYIPATTAGRLFVRHFLQTKHIFLPVFRIRMFLGLPDPDPSIIEHMTFYLRKWFKCSSNSNKQNNFSCHLEGHWQNSRIRSRIR